MSLFEAAEIAVVRPSQSFRRRYLDLPRPLEELGDETLTKPPPLTGRTRQDNLDKTSGLPDSQRKLVWTGKKYVLKV